MNAAMASRGAGTSQPVIRASRIAEIAVIGQSAFRVRLVFTDAARRKLPSHQPGGGTWLTGYDLRRRSREVCIPVRRETAQALRVFRLVISLSRWWRHR